MDRLTPAVARAITKAPCSLRRLAKEAGVPHVTLVWIVSGKRAATPAVALKVAAALDRWSARCGGLARGIRRAQAKGES